MTDLCPHCGFNLVADEPLERGPWRLEPYSAYLDGQRIRITPQEAGFLHTLAKAGGRPIAAVAIGERISNGDEPVNLARVIAVRLRQKLPRVPFETIHGSGYRWAA